MTLILSVGAFAQERVELNAEKVSVKGNKSILVRTNKTPDTVEVEFEVPMANQICERTETRHVLRRSGTYCGYDTFIRRVQVGQVCTRKNPYNDECLKFEPAFREERVTTERTCMVPESFCAQYGTSTSFIKDTMTIQFKKLPALGDSEGDTFEVGARQKNYDGIDVIYDFKPLETVQEYKVSQKRFLFFKRDAFVVEKK